MNNCFGSLVKYLLFGSNILIFLSSLAVLGGSIYVLVDGSELSELVSLSQDDIGVAIVDVAAIFLIILSVVVIIVSFFGCCGAIKESRTMLGIYTVLVILLLGGMITGLVIASNQGLDGLRQPLNTTLSRYHEGATEPEDVARITELWDELQEHYECCGVSGPTDYDQTQINDPSREWPESCCVNDNCEAENTPFPDGCFDKFRDSIQASENLVWWTSLGGVLFMFVNIVAALVVCAGITDYRYA